MSPLTCDCHSPTQSSNRFLSPKNWSQNQYKDLQRPIQFTFCIPSLISSPFVPLACYIPAIPDVQITLEYIRHSHALGFVSSLWPGAFTPPSVYIAHLNYSSLWTSVVFSLRHTITTLFKIMLLTVHSKSYLSCSILFYIALIISYHSILFTATRM